MPSELFQEWSKRDPIGRFGLWLSEHAQLGEAEQSEIENEVKALLSEAQQRAEASPMPDPAELEQGVYAESTEAPGATDA